MQESKRRPASSPAHQQRGVAAVIVAIAVVALFASLALAVDIGQLYYAQRDLEKQASLAAIAGAQVASGCRGNGGVPAGLSTVSAMVSNAIALNPASASSGTAAPTSTTQLGWVNDASGEVLTDINGTTLFAAPADGKRHFFQLADNNPLQSPKIKAVQVVLTRPQPTLLIPFLSGSGSGGAKPLLSATAVAEQEALGSFSLGTTLATLTTVNSSLLNGLLGGLLCAPNDKTCQAGINLNAAGFQGLLGTSVTLGELGTAVGVNSLDLSSLLTTSVTLPQLLSGLSPVLNTVPGLVSSNITGLLSATNSTPVTLGNVIGAVDGAAANVPFINLLDLLTAVGEDAQAAATGGVNPILLPISISNLPTGIGVSTFLKIGSPAMASGSTNSAQSSGLAPAGVARASTAEVTLQIRLDSGSLISGLTSSIGSVLQLAGVAIIPGVGSKIGVDVAVAPATATLDTLLCPDANASPPTSSPTANLSGTTGIATVKVGTYTGNASTDPTLTPATSVPVLSINLLGTPLYTLNLNLTSVGVGSTAFTLNPINQFLAPTLVLAPTPDLLQYIPNGVPTAAPAIGPGTLQENPQTFGSAQGVSLSASLATVPGAAVPPLISGAVNTLLGVVNLAVQGLVNTLSGLLTGTISPVLAGLGVQTGSATVTMQAVVIPPPKIVSISQAPQP